MESPQLFPSPHPHYRTSLRTQTKEEFFTTKRKLKRMKSSLCFSEPLKRRSIDHSLQEISFLTDKNDTLNQELESTFGSEHALALQTPPILRKHNTQLIKEQLRQCQSDSQGELPLVSPGHSKSKSEALQQLKQWNLKQLLQNHYHTPSIEDFFIFEKLGEGTYSQVFKAVERHTGFLCALKIMDKHQLKEQKLEENIIREIKLCTFIDHPNIIKIYASFHDENYIYLVQQYATDKNLFDYSHQPRIKLRKGMMSDQVAKLIGQLTNATKYLHNHNIMHRDIKPQNVLITLNDTVKLCDFGWAIHNANKEMRSTFCGTPLYLAPELVAQNLYDESVDVWAIGVITYEMMTDQNPFRIAEFSHIRRILFDQVRYEGIRNKVAIDFMTKALRKDPDRRKSIYELNSHPFLEGSQEPFIQI